MLRAGGHRLEGGKAARYGALSQYYRRASRRVTLVSFRLVDQIHRTEMPALTAVEKHVLAYMGTHADDDGGGVFCGVATISKMTNLGIRTVERAIAELRRKQYLFDAGWVRRKRRFDIRLTGGGPVDDLTADDFRPTGDIRLTGGSTSASLTPDIRLSDVLSSNGSGPLTDPLTSSVCGTSPHGVASGVGEVKTAEDFMDDDDEDAGDPPLVVRQATEADWEKLDKGTLRRLPVDVLEAAV